MEASRNPEWKINGSTATLTTEDIEPGESKTYEVILKWNNGSSNFGGKVNTAELIKVYNDAGFAEKNVGDNKDSATAIIEVKTGMDKQKILIITISSLVVLIIAAIVIKSKK